MKNILRIAISLGMSFAILALLLQAVTAGVPDDQRPSVLNALMGTTSTLVLGYFFIYLLTLVVRAYRYRLFLQMSGEINVPSLKQMALVTGVRNMVVDMLPARIGELGYVALLNRGYGVRLQHCVSSMTIGIAFDLLALLIIVMLILIVQLMGTGLQPWAPAALISAIAISLIAFIGLFVVTPVVSRWLNRRFLADLNTQSAKAKLLNLLHEFSQSLTAVRKAGRTIQVLSLSLVIRLLKYFSLYLLFRAVAVPNFIALAELPVEQVVSALIGGEIGASLPIPTFMSFGTYEAGSALVFQLLGVADKAAAVVTMLCVHIWSQMVDYLIGATLLVLFIFLNRQAKRDALQTDASDQTTGTRFGRWAWLGGATAAFVLGSSFLAWELRAAKKVGAITAPAAGQVADNVEQWQQFSKQHVSNIDGFVVFSSNRDGNHDIFKLDLKEFKLTKITTHSHTENYPRISPDGKRLVFARAHQPWVSLRNIVAWDVYVKDLASGRETRVGRNGTAPQWLNNGQITYSKRGTTLVKVSLDELKEEIIYQTGKGNRMPAGAKLQNPEANPLTGQVVFTGRQNQIGMSSGHWGTAVTIGNDHRGLFNGCEISWTSDGKGLYQVTKGGRKEGGGLRFVWIDPLTFESETMIDLEGEFSHEYWPKDSANGEYMVFGASRGGKDQHEHDTSDYEIFLWKVGSDSSKATRLTFHTGNDSWPDVYIRD